MGLFDSVVHLVTEGDGLDGLVKKLGESGLDDKVKSWIGKGENLPISAEQIEKVLGNEHVAAVAQRLGISPEKASGQIADLLPKLIDRITPDAEVPDSETAKQRVAAAG
jgi:uncharacterized protein YidB (DUF937 family)